MTASINKKDAYSSIKHLVEHAKKKNSPEYEKLTTAIFNEVLPAYIPNRSDRIKREISLGGEDLSDLLNALTPEQISKFHIRTKIKKDAAYYGLQNALEPSYTEKDLKALLNTQKELSGDIEKYQERLVKATARAAQKEPIAKNSAQRPDKESHNILTKSYPESFNNAAELIQRLQELLLQIKEAQGKVAEQALKARQAIDVKKGEVQKLSQKLAEEKNNLDNHDRLTKDWSSKYPYVTVAKNDTQITEWSLENFSKLLNQLNDVIGALNAYMLNEGQKCLIQLTGRRHALQTAIGEMSPFKAESNKTQVRYDVTQGQLQQKMDSLQGLLSAIDTLEKQLQESLDSVTKDSQAKLQLLVKTFKDYTAKANALVPYALTEEGKLREVRTLTSEKNERYPEVI